MTKIILGMSDVSRTVQTTICLLPELYVSCTLTTRMAETRMVRVRVLDPYTFILLETAE